MAPSDIPDLASVADRARTLATELGDDPAAERLRRSVLRPLGDLLDEDAGAPDPGSAPGAESPGERLWSLALDSTRLRADGDADPRLVEATAALQDLAIAIAPGRVAELAAAQAELPSEVRLMARGPLLVTNPPRIHDWLDVDLEARPQMALCRCGRSAIKPLCDGRHAEGDGFADGKDPDRQPDRRDSYPGLRATVLDNRGLCAHSGFCTDRVPTVFHAGGEPFVTPSGGRFDEVEAAVRACPSGALSLAVDGVEERTIVDTDREPAIEVSKDGPYRLTGGVAVVDADGSPVRRNDGASLEHCSLCRCGSSRNKPFCSGRHWDTHFTDPPLADDPSLFEWAGGFPALERLTTLFYSKHVPADELLAPRFASMSPDHPQRVAAWLGETFGGPPRYTERYGGYARMVSEHIGKELSEAERARWAALMVRSADEAKLPTDPEFRAAFTSYVEWGSRIAVENSAADARPPEGMPVPKWWWVCNATPGARRSALAPEEEAVEVELPPPGEPISFASHIRPMFRPMDRDSMKFAFDLWDHDDVAAHGAAILQRLRAGTMPCDGAWPSERVDGFARWVDEGAAA